MSFFLPRVSRFIENDRAARASNGGDTEIGY